MTGTFIHMCLCVCFLVSIETPESSSKVFTWQTKRNVKHTAHLITGFTTQQPHSSFSTLLVLRISLKVLR